MIPRLKVRKLRSFALAAGIICSIGIAATSGSLAADEISVANENLEQRPYLNTVAGHLVWVLLFQVRCNHVHFSLRLRKTDSRLQTRDSVQAWMIATLLPTRLA